MEARRVLSRWGTTQALLLTAVMATVAGPAVAAPLDQEGLSGPAGPPLATTASLNLPPIPFTPSVTMDEDTGPRAITLRAFDPNGDPLTFDIVDAPDHGTLTGTGADRAYTPDQDFSGSDAFTFRVSDGRGGTAQQRVAITVRPVRDAPSIAPSPFASTYTVGGPPVPVDPNIAVHDPDSPNFLAATVRIEAGRQAGDVLAIAPTPGLITWYDASSGTLAIIGVAPQATYVAALRSVTFASSSANPGTSRTIRYTVDDTTLLRGQATRQLAIVPAQTNDPPVNDVPASFTVDEDGSRALTDFSVTDPDAGADDVETRLTAEHGTFTFGPSSGATVTGDGTAAATITGTVTEVNAALAGATYAPDADFNGSDTITVVTDDLGHNPPPALSDTDTVAVTVTPVADAPDLEQPDTAPLTYTEDDPAEDHAVAVVPNLTIAYDDGTSLTGATVRLTGDAPGDELLFTDQAGITGSYDGATATLTLTGSASVADYQAALRSVRYRTTSEDPGTAPRIAEIQVADGAIESDTVTRTIDVVPTNDGPTADDEALDGTDRAVGNTSLVVDDPTDGAPDPAGPQKTVTGDVLDGDADPDDGAGELTVVPGTFATAGGGTVTIEADGDFTYLPEQGCADTTDSFDYTVSDGDATDTGTVTIQIADCVWYVDASAPPQPTATGGTSQAPYDSLADLRSGSDEDGPGDRIFLHDGTYPGGLPLEDGQDLLSERHGLTVPDGGAGTVVLQPANPGAGRSRIDDGVTAATDNTLQGIDLGDAAAGALAGTSVGTLVVNTETSGGIVNTLGGGVQIGGTGNQLDLRLSELTTNGGPSGLSLANATGTVVASGGTIANATTADVQLTGGAVDLTLGAAIADDTGRLVSITGQTGGTKDLDGAIADGPAAGDGGGIELQDNTGATIRFDGGLRLSTGATPAFAATGGGTVAVTDPAGAASNTLETTTGTPLTVANTTIHADDLTFERVASSGAQNGIALTDTGAAGGLAVTGAGGACTAATATCTGGTIQGSTGAGVALSGVGGGVDLTRVRIAGGQDDGVRATGVSGLRLADALVTGNGNAAQERGLDLVNVTGAAALTGSQVSGSFADNARLANAAGSVDLDVTGSTLAGSANGDGLQVSGDGTATVRTDVAGSTLQGNRDDGFQLLTPTTSSATMHLTFDDNAVGADASQVTAGALVTLSPAGGSQTRVAMDGNTLDTAKGSGLVLAPAGTAQFDATVTETLVQNTGAIGIWGRSVQSASSRMRIADSTVRAYGAVGMYLAASEGSGSASYLVHGNTLTDPAAGAAEGLFVEAGALSTDTVQVCADIGGPGALANDLGGAGGPGGYDDVAFSRYQNAQLRLPGLAGDLQTYVQSRNLGSPTAISYGPLDPTGGPACTAPVLPPAA